MEFDTLTLTHKEQVFVTQYFQTALWADHADELSLGDIDEDCLREGTIDALCFFSRAWAYLSDDNCTDAAHTFYLVRQGHGVSFSDHPENFSDFAAQYLEKLASGFFPVDYFTKDGTMFYDIGMIKA